MSQNLGYQMSCILGLSDLVNYIKRSTADRTTEGTSQVDYLETVFQIKYQLWSPDGVIYS